MKYQTRIPTTWSVQDLLISRAVTTSCTRAPLHGCWTNLGKEDVRPMPRFKVAMSLIFDNFFLFFPF